MIHHVILNSTLKRFLGTFGQIKVLTNEGYIKRKCLNTLLFELDNGLQHTFLAYFCMRQCGEKL